MSRLLKNLIAAGVIALGGFFIYAQESSAAEDSKPESEFVAELANAIGWTDVSLKFGKRDLDEFADKSSEGDAKFCRGVMLYRGIFFDKDKRAAAKLFKESADLGNPYGMAAYAFSLRDGDGFLSDETKPDELFKKAAAEGVAFAARCVGEKLLRSDKVSDNEMGFEFVKMAAEMGDVYSKVVLASCYDRGLGIKKDKAEAVNLLSEAAAAGNGAAHFALAVIGVKNGMDDKEIFKLYQKAAKTNFPPALSALGICYLYGAGVEQDVDKAVGLIRQAAEEGVMEAQNAMAVCYASGAGVEQNPEKAFEWFKRAAQLGEHEAQNNLGNCYYYGKGVAENPQEALKWYRLAAAQGNVAAQSSLALLYLEGKGKNKDAKDAIVWLLRAAQSGDVEAQSNLGKCYLEGIGIEQNYELAVKWLALAAKAKDAEALGNLGGCYYLGLGVERDQERAKILLKEAAALGNEEAGKAYYRIYDK